MIFWEVFVVITIAIFWQFFLFNRFDKILADKIDPIKEGITEIKTSLNNYITDTNKKIETLNNTLIKQFKDHNKQIVDLYKVLIDKQ